MAADSYYLFRYNELFHDSLSVLPFHFGNVGYNGKVRHNRAPHIRLQSGTVKGPMMTSGAAAHVADSLCCQCSFSKGVKKQTASCSRSQTMNKTKKLAYASPIAILAAVGLAMLFLASCETINRLAEFDIQDHTLAVQMRLPPEPEMDVHYNLDFSSTFAAVLSVGSTIAKAANSDRVERLMRQALQVVDVPEMVRDESYSTCLTVLEAQQEHSIDSADYLLDFDIHKWGIHANSWTSAVSLRMKLTANIFSNSAREVVWRREIEIERKATPGMFGLPLSLGNFVTSAALASLSEEDLQNGFDQLARDTALTISRTLQNDLYDGLYGS